MTTRKPQEQKSKTSMNTSKVRNTKARNQYKTGKNVVSESLIRESFRPLFSRIDGTARLTFCGIEHSSITLKGEEKPIIRIAFSCLDVTHEAPQIIGITVNYNYSPENKLGKVLELMGFQPIKQIDVIDDEDEFGIRETNTNLSEIFDFFRSKVGLVFKGKLIPAKRKNKVTGEYEERKGLWDIVPESLTPRFKGDEQESDLMPSDITDEAFLNPEIAMSDELG
jgi:hypothetical protein